VTGSLNLIDIIIEGDNFVENNIRDYIFSCDDLPFEGKEYFLEQNGRKFYRVYIHFNGDQNQAKIFTKIVDYIDYIYHGDLLYMPEPISYSNGIITIPPKPDVCVRYLSAKQKELVRNHLISYYKCAWDASSDEFRNSLIEM
jgi:hypothetical protein